MNLLAIDLLAELSIRGIAVRPEGGRLLLRPRSALTPDLLARAAGLKRDLHALLTSHLFSHLATGGACPTSDEWRILQSLARATDLNRSQLLAATRLPQLALDPALANLCHRREVQRSPCGRRYSLVRS